MAFFASAGHTIRRHPLRLAGLAGSAALAALALNFLMSGPSAEPSGATYGVQPFSAREPAVNPPNPWYARRTVLYLVASESDAFRLRSNMARASYAEMGGPYAARWTVQVMGEGITLQAIEEMNLARIYNGVPPFRVIDTR